MLALSVHCFVLALMCLRVLVSANSGYEFEHKVARQPDGEGAVKVFYHRKHFCTSPWDPQLGDASVELVDTAAIFRSTGKIPPSPFVLRTSEGDYPSRLVAQPGNSAFIPSHNFPREGIRNSVIMPNTTDKQTVVNLAKMTSDAYIYDPGAPDWLNTTLGFNFTCRFGWKEDGLRGHIFSTEDNSIVIVAFKGTTVDPSEPTLGRDRFNNVILFGCCCGAQHPWGYPAACNCSTGYNECDSRCLTEALLQNDTYYNAAVQTVQRVQEIYPHAMFWTVGHSLGGSLASLVGLTLNIPAVTFEAPPDRLPARRMGLLPPNATSPDPKRAKTHHFGHTADPIFMGECNKFFSSCSVWGFSFDSQCFSGRRCAYDTRRDKGWGLSIFNHRINYVIQYVLEAYDDVPKCKEDDECEDCRDWKFS